MSDFDGMLRIVRFNWPSYLVSLVTCAVLSALRRRFSHIRAVRWPATLGIAMSGYWSVASLLVSHYVYDLSELTDWQVWLPGLLTRPPQRALNVHVGRDEVGPSLRDVLGGIETTSIDVYDPAAMRSGSIRRARVDADQRHARQDGNQHQKAPMGDVQRVDWHALPFADSSYNVELVMFAAHELRDRTARRELFRELRRVLSADGQIVLVEHARDLANLLAFGPGVLHFFPLQEWRSVALDAGLRVTTERKLTPFVTAMVLERSTS